MAGSTIDLKSEERRRQLTLGALGGLLLATTLPVVNQRALFSPLGDVPILGDLSPGAYAATFGVGGPIRFGRRPGAFSARAQGGSGRGSGSSGGDLGSSAGNPTVAGSTTPLVPLASAGRNTVAAQGGDGGAGLPGGADGNGGSAPGAGIPGGDGGGGLPGTGGGNGGGTGDGIGGVPGGGSSNPSIPSAVGAVPEPATWLTLILGFATIGSIMRRTRRRNDGRPRVSAG